MMDTMSKIASQTEMANFVNLSRSPNGLVILALYEFLGENGVKVRWGSLYLGEYVARGEIDPHFFVIGFSGLPVFKVRFYVDACEARVLDLLHPSGSGYPIISAFPICDPKCFEGVLGVVK